jgi:hypothetical protein
MIGLEARDSRSRAACGDERYEPIKAALGRLGSLGRLLADDRIPMTGGLAVGCELGRLATQSRHGRNESAVDLQGDARDV